MVLIGHFDFYMYFQILVESNETENTEKQKKTLKEIFETRGFRWENSFTHLTQLQM